ncbi:MAG: hypothetical protein WCO02_12570 [Bacteroidota bacterium]
MDKEEQDINLIEKFLKGELTHNEAVDFETRVDEDHEFARKLRLRKTFPSLFNAQGHDAIVMDVDAKPEEAEPVRKVRKPVSRRLLWLVVALVLLAAGGFVAFYFILPLTWSSKHPAIQVKPSSLTSANKKNLQLKPAPPSSAVNKQAAIPVTAAQTTTPIQTPKTEVKPQPAGRPQAVELILPIDNEVVSRGQDVVFRWKLQTDTFTNFYLISSANNKLAWWRGVKPGVRELTIPAINFKPGNFYWYVGRKEFRRTLIVADI